jgi:hypothetical protein
MEGPRPFAFRARLALTTVIAFGLVIRLLQLRHGLPEFLEEAWPFREAWGMWGWESGHLDLNPHRFHYPSLTFYLHLALQFLVFAGGRITGAWHSAADFFLAYETDPSALVIAARAMATLADLAGLAAIVWIGERIRPRAGLIAGLGLFASFTLVESVRAIVPDTYMAALAMGALLAMLAYLRHGGRGAFVATTVLIGLATGAKYPAATLLVPFALVLAMRDGRAAWRLWPLAAAGAAAVFFVTTPFALLDPVSFGRDLGFVRQLPGAGHLGRLEGTGAAFDFGVLWRNMRLGLIALPVSLAITLVQWRRRREEVVLWIALLGFALPVFTATVEAARYMVPVIGIAWLLAAAAAIDLVDRVPARRRWLAEGVLIMLPISATVFSLHALRPVDSTQTNALRWFEHNADDSQLIVQEAYGAPLFTRWQALEMRSHPQFERASEAARRRFTERRSWRAVQLPFTTVGPGTVIVQDAAGHDVTVQLAAHSVDFNHLSYDPRLFADVDLIVVTSAVHDRFVADSARFRAATRFYQLLERTARVEARIEAGMDAAGPDITIYRMTPELRAAIEQLGAIDPLWWAATLPLDGRRALETRALPEAARFDGALRLPDGAPAPWVHLLEPMYKGLIRPFAHPMSVYLVELGRDDSAAFFAAATLEVVPDDVEACLVYTTARGALGQWPAARVAIERTLHAVERGGEPPTVLQFEYARILRHTDDVDFARQVLESLSRNSDPGVAAEAHRELEEAGP